MGSTLGSEELSRMKKNMANMAAVIPKDHAHDIAIRCRSSACNVIIYQKMGFLSENVKVVKNVCNKKRRPKTSFLYFQV